MSGFITRIEREKEEPYTVIFTTDDHDKYLHIEKECRIMIDHAKPQTNADRIRAMTDEELAEFIAKKCCDCPPGISPAPLGCDDVCKECWLDWLRQEAST